MTATQSKISNAATVQSKSQWALIWNEFKKRRLAVAAAALVLALITTSVFAPFLANARPIFYVGINRFEYQEAARTLRGAMSQQIEALAKDSALSIPDATIKTIALQMDLMESALPPEKSAELSELENKILNILRSSGMEGRSDALRQLQRELRSSFDASSVTLVSKSHWPVFASLNAADVGFQVANILFLLTPLWIWLLRRLVPVENDHIRRRVYSFLVMGLPLIAGMLWWWQVPYRVDRTEYKSGVLAADPDAAKAPVVYESVMWPPIAYGIDEYDLAGKSAAPAWYPAKWCPPGKDAASIKLASQWSGPHWLGTDASGRDVLCRMIWGGRVSLSVGLVAVAIYVTIGIIVGALAGYYRGWCDLLISRIIEVMICFPTFFLILTIVALVGQNIVNIMIVIGLTGWTGIARLVRGEFLRLVDQEFVVAGRALGYTPMRIIFRHVLPNAMAPVLVSATFGIAGAILTESGLSFLGLGISKPTPSWGGLLADGRDSLQHAPWLIHFPGLAIFLTITAYNLMGEALRDASDPRLRGSR